MDGNTLDQKIVDDGRAAALSAFEEACNYIALVFDQHSEQRRIAITARGDMRDACGEART